MQGVARHVEAGQGLAIQGSRGVVSRVRTGQDWCGPVWQFKAGMVRSVVVRNGAVRPGLAIQGRHGEARRGKVGTGKTRQARRRS